MQGRRSEMRRPTIVRALTNKGIRRPAESSSSRVFAAGDRCRVFHDSALQVGRAGGGGGGEWVVAIKPARFPVVPAMDNILECLTTTPSEGSGGRCRRKDAVRRGVGREEQ